MSQMLQLQQQQQHQHHLKMAFGNRAGVLNRMAGHMADSHS